MDLAKKYNYFSIDQYTEPFTMHNAMLIKDSHACSVCLDFQVTPKSSALIILMHNDTNHVHKG